MAYVQRLLGSRPSPSLLLAFIFFYNPNLMASHTHNPAQILSKLRGSKNEGAEIVRQFCASCHAPKPLIELGAPKIGCAKDWKLRLKQGKMVLLQHTEEGLGAMPARGGCFECSDEQLQLAIESMLRQGCPIKN